MYILSLFTHLIVYKYSGKRLTARKSCDLSMITILLLRTFWIFLSRTDVHFMVMVDDLEDILIRITLHDQDCDLSSQLADGEVIFRYSRAVSQLMLLTKLHDPICLIY